MVYLMSMKFILTILFLFSITFGRSNFNVIAGLGKSSFVSSNSNSETSYSIGVSHNIYIGNSDLIISFGGNFLQRASSKNDLIVFSRSLQPNWEVFKYDMTFYVNYFEVPILLKYDFTLKEDLYLTPFVGGSFSFAVHSRTERNNKQYAGIASELEPGLYIEQEDQHLENDYGIIVGLDLKYERISFGASYYFGMNTLSNIENFSGLDESFQSIMFNFAYTL